MLALFPSPTFIFGLCKGKSLQLALCIVLLVNSLTSDMVEDKVTKTNNCMVIVKKGRLF